MTHTFPRADVGVPTIDSRVLTLVESVEHGDARSRRQAAEALGRIGDARAVSTLCSTLASDNSPDVRRAAARALGRIGDMRAIKPLCAALVTDAEWYVRQTVATALDRIRGDRSSVSTWPFITIRG